eukprot:3868541-Alexandrium_andersonii.AAC.1
MDSVNPWRCAYMLGRLKWFVADMLGAALLQACVRVCSFSCFSLLKVQSVVQCCACPASATAGFHMPWGRPCD